MERSGSVYIKSTMLGGGFCKILLKKVEKFFVGVLTRRELCSIIMFEGCYTRRYDNGS